jgi:hypothetical protein
MSEQIGEQTGAESGSPGAGPAVSSSSSSSSEAPSQPVTVSAKESAPEASDVDLSKLAPGQGGAGETSKMETPKPAPFRLDPFKPDTSKPGASKPGASKPDAAKADAPRPSDKITIMSTGHRAGSASEAEPGSGMFGKRRLAALAAVVALAVVAGALGGALATAGVGHFLGDGAATSAGPALEASVARIDADILTLMGNLEHISKTSQDQFNKTSDRLDKVEKAQAEPAAKSAKLGETVDKLHVAPAAAAAAATPAAAKEVTGSISPPATTPAAAPAPKPEVARLPTVEGWVLRDVANGAALIEGRRGMFEVYAGDPIPGLGRVDAIRRQDGRWVVVTGKGLIVAR